MSAHLSAALQNAHHDGFVPETLPSSGDAALMDALVHVPGLAADESFVGLNLVRRYRRVSRREPSCIALRMRCSMNHAVF
jgi:hypothetical protein